MAFATYIVLHLAVTFLVGAFSFLKWGKGQAFCETLLVLALPIWGLCLWIVFHGVDIWYPLLVEKQPPLPKKREVLSFGEIPYDEDMIPLRDAFLLDDVYKKRKFFTESIKQNVVSDQDILLSAMHDEDREMSYYAVSMMTTRMENLENRLIEIERDLEEKKTLENLQKYASLLKDYLSHQKFMDHFSFAEKEDQYRRTLQKLIQKDPGEKEPYVNLYGLWMQKKQWDEVEKVCIAYKKQFGMDERAFLFYIEWYEKIKDKKAMMAMIGEMKKSSLVLSKKALQVIRYWDRGSQS